MPKKFKTSLNLSETITNAARRRVQDEAHRDLDEEELERLTRMYLLANESFKPPNINGRQPLDGPDFERYIKDSKFTVDIFGHQLFSLEEELTALRERNWSTLDDLERQAEALESTFTEEEIRRLGKYQLVHYNNFVRPGDQPIGWEDKQWLTDPKSQQPFLQQNLITVDKGLGGTLPRAWQEDILVADAKLVGEATDVGDTQEPLVNTGVKNTVGTRGVFRYVIIKREFDDTTRPYAKDGSEITILLRLMGTQLVNALDVRLANQQILEIKDLSSISASGDETTIDTTDVLGDTEVKLLFEPVHAQYLKLTLRQNVPVGKTVLSTGGNPLNTFLQDTSLKSRLPGGTTEEIQGRIFDFSIKQIIPKLIEYRPVGLFRSRRKAIEAPAGISVTPNAISEPEAAGGSSTVPRGTHETYIGIELKDGEGTVLRRLLPLVDETPFQEEQLVTYSVSSGTKLVPDLRWNMKKLRVVSTTTTGSNKLRVTTEKAHDLGRRAGFFGNPQHYLSGEKEITSVSATEFDIEESLTGGLNLTVDDNTYPRIWVFDPIGQPDPMDVYEGTTKLSIGSDFEVSLDNGKTWYSEWPQNSEFTGAFRRMLPGDFRIKIASHTTAKIYNCRYRSLDGQRLVSDGTIRLRNGNIVFGGRWAKTTGWVQTIFILRTSNQNHFTTPVMDSYATKVMYNVSKSVSRDR